jgi:hypothetical protein
VCGRSPVGAKHGILDEDVHHACDHALVVDQLDVESDPPKLLVIGPDRTGRLLKVVVPVLADERLMAIHAMPFRAAFYDLLPPPQDHHD